MSLRPFDFPAALLAAGARDAAYVAVADAGDLEVGSMRRVTHDGVDVLLASLPVGLVAVADRCPHMSAPLSIGVLEGCVVACPLHMGTFDLSSGDPVRMPNTGGLDPDGNYHPVWTPSGNSPKVDPPGKKAEARRLTRVQRFRYFPIRIVDGRVEVAIPV